MDGGGTSVEYEQSPEARMIMQAMMPMIQGLGQYGSQRYFGGGQGGPSGAGSGPPEGYTGTTGGALSGRRAMGGVGPQMGAPSMSGVLTSQPMYDIPQNRVPDPSSAMPTADWWGALSPNVKAGLYAPYHDAGNMMMQQMGSRGQLGSSRGGLSGASGAAMGKLAGEAAKNVGLNAWQMTAPAAQAAWQGQLNQNNAMWGADLARNQQAYNVGQQERVADYNTAMNVWQMPQQLMGMAPQFMPQGIVQPGSNTMGNMFGGGLMGGMAGGSMFGPWGAVGGGALGALSGLFS
jgi:hypothetical protein